MRIGASAPVYQFPMSLIVSFESYVVMSKYVKQFLCHLMLICALCIPLHGENVTFTVCTSVCQKGVVDVLGTCVGDLGISTSCFYYWPSAKGSYFHRMT